jgi:hypothetical protein
MHYRNDRPSGFQENREGVVEVKIWEAFLLYNRHNVYSTLSTYDIDSGLEQQRDHDQGSVMFRFTKYDWENTLKRLLAKHNIPVVNVTEKSTEGIANFR